MADEIIERGSANWITQPQLPGPAIGKPVDWIALNAAVNSTANLEEKDGKLVTVGNSTEGALLQWLRRIGDRLISKFAISMPPLYQLHFSSERKRMTTVIRSGERLVVLVKGAPEWVLANCTHFLGTTATIQALDAEQCRQDVEQQLRAAADQAMRTLAFAFALLPPDTPSDEDGLHARRDARKGA